MDISIIGRTIFYIYNIVRTHYSLNFDNIVVSVVMRCAEHTNLGYKHLIESLRELYRYLGLAERRLFN